MNIYNPMAKERSVTPRSSSQGRERRSVSKSNSLQSETPTSKAAQDGSQPKLKLKLRFSDSGVNADPHPTIQNGQNKEYSHHLPPCATLPQPVTTRTGRTIHKPQHVDVVQGSEYDHMMGLSYEGLEDDDRKFESPMPSDYPRTPGKAHRHSPYRLSNAYQHHRSVGRPHRTNEDEEWPSSAALQAQSPTSEHGSFEPSQDVYAILSSLQHTTKVQLDLPCLSNATDPDYFQPYSAQLLTHLYITCYQSKLWNLCDMIADTWIRAFHARRKKSQTASEHQLWRPNKALEQRKRKAYEAWKGGHYVSSEFDPEPRYYGLEVSDPDLAPDVTNMHIDLLNTLYEHTQPDCGARMIWADALALAGDYTEKSIDAAQKRGLQLNQDLVFNVMQTSLRMVRRKLTLKIEESTEGAWCRRYHEHAKHGQPCYREVAAKSKEGDGDGQAEVGEEAYHAFLQGKNVDKVQRVQWLEGRKHDAKHVSFGDDTDADGDSVEE